MQVANQITKTIPFQFGEMNLNVIQENSNPWFIAKDVSEILGYKSASDAIRGLDEDEKLLRTICVSGQNRELNLINESGLYSLILRSKKPEAKDFKRWVTHEVLPSIRKHGAYLTPQKTEDLLANPDLIIELATSLKNERLQKAKLLNEIDLRNEVITEQDTQLRIQSPIVDYYKTVIQSTNTIGTNIIAKELGMSAITLNKILQSEYSLIYKQGGTWLPVARIQNLGYTKTRTYTYTGSDGSVKSNIQMVWTQKGREFIHSLWKLRN